jgi:hypothetical protein
MLLWQMDARMLVIRENRRKGAPEAVGEKIGDLFGGHASGDW